MFFALDLPGEGFRLRHHLIVQILRVIGLVNAPDLMIILTHGGPGLATHVLSLLAFNDAYTGFDFGAAAAVATVMLVVLMGFTSLYVRVSGVTRD